MKLENILDKLGSLEKNSFIKIIDNIISDAPKNHKQIENILNTTDKNLKTVDSSNISKIFMLVQDEFLNYLKLEFQDTDSQLDIMVDIMIRDGNCIMRQDWMSRLYDEEIKSLKGRIKQLNQELENDKSEISSQRKRDYKIYKACLHTAYFNDIDNNRDAKVTSEELSIIL